MLGPVVISVRGTRLTEAERTRLRHPLVGMVILFHDNFENAQQLAELTAEIHALRDPPPLIAVDHEGGRVQRFRTAPFTRLPPMAVLGRRWDADVLAACRAAISTGIVLGSELRACGVDFSFTPVLDLDWGRSEVIGDRSFHADARTVAMLANHLNHGLALAGMANCGKHFPGHGWAVADSHVALPVDERPLDDLLARDAAPYAWMGGALTSVMPAHVVYSAVDALPACFSRRWLQEILRGRLGFTGAVFSDDLKMEGARAAGTVLESAQAALAAGCDFVLVCKDAQACDELLGGLRWTPTQAFGERAARMRPRGPAPSWASLAASEWYQAAKAEVLALA